MSGGRYEEDMHTCRRQGGRKGEREGEGGGGEKRAHLQSLAVQNEVLHRHPPRPPSSPALRVRVSVWVVAAVLILAPTKQGRKLHCSPSPSCSSCSCISLPVPVPLLLLLWIGQVQVTHDLAQHHRGRQEKHGAVQLQGHDGARQTVQDLLLLPPVSSQ